MKTVTVKSQFAVHPDELWREIQKTRLLLHVARPILKIRPLDPSKLPEFWEEKNYEVSLWLGGVLPLGRQSISITWPKTDGTRRSVRDNGHGRFVRRWDHTITIEPVREGTSYEDLVAIEAGLFTPVVAVFAKIFYRHRQRRLRSLIERGFDCRK